MPPGTPLTCDPECDSVCVCACGGCATAHPEEKVARMAERVNESVPRAAALGTTDSLDVARHGNVRAHVVCWPRPARAEQQQDDAEVELDWWREKESKADAVLRLLDDMKEKADSKLRNLCRVERKAANSFGRLKRSLSLSR